MSPLPDATPDAPEEYARLAALRACAILDTPPEADFDKLATLAAHICGAPIALITLLDEERQWFKARIGIDVQETPREVAFCAVAIQQRDLFVVPDAQADARFSANPLVLGEPRIRFYAGAPLVTSEGHALGTLCVIDRVPRVLSPEQEFALRILGRHVAVLLDLRRAIPQRERVLRELVELREQLEQRVAERTAEVLAANARLRAEMEERERTERQVAEQLEELRRWYRATIGREDRVQELKREVNALRERLGEAPEYPSAQDFAPFQVPGK